MNPAVQDETIIQSIIGSLVGCQDDWIKYNDKSFKGMVDGICHALIHLGVAVQRNYMCHSCEKIFESDHDQNLKCPHCGEDDEFKILGHHLSECPCPDCREKAQ
tara:strand:- start:188 stop:499 length:312 start_codon:yes stop_codon:yes gene_type:complete